MTGRHTGHCTVRQNGQFLNASDVTVATVLKKAGYATALVGKWGLGKETLVLYYPHYIIMMYWLSKSQAVVVDLQSLEGDAL